MVPAGSGLVTALVNPPPPGICSGSPSSLQHLLCHATEDTCLLCLNACQNSYTFTTELILPFMLSTVSM